MPTNLISNPLFDLVVDGKIYTNPFPNLSTVAVPHGWQVRWVSQAAANSPVPGESSMPLPSQDQPFIMPEFVVWPVSDAPANEVEPLFGSFPVIYKIFHGYAPIWFAVFQNADVVEGEPYRFSLSANPDLVSSMSGSQKVFAPDPLSGEFRLLGESQWHMTDEVLCGQWTRLSFDFTATDNVMQVGLEFRGRHGLLNNGVFIRDPQLVWMGDTTPPPPVSGELEAWQWVERIAKERIAALMTDPVLRARREAIAVLSSRAGEG